MMSKKPRIYFDRQDSVWVCWDGRYLGAGERIKDAFASWKRYKETQIGIERDMINRSSGSRDL
jgi:hypothetical protein